MTIDAPLLAFAALQTRPAVDGRLLDAGCGVGVIGLVFLLHRPRWSGTLLDLQPEMAALAAENAAASGVANAGAESGDLRDPAAAPGPFDLILCNPPYFSPAAHTRSPHAQKNLSKFELALRLRDLNGLLAPRLSPGGTAWLIIPEPRADELAEGPLAIVARRPVLHSPGAPAGRVLVALARRPLAVEPDPLVVYADAAMKKFTPELGAFLAGRGLPRAE